MDGIIDKMKDLKTKHILNDMADGVMTIETDGKISYINPAAEKILQVSREIAEGSKIGRLLLEDERNDGFLQSILDAIYERNKKENSLVEYYPTISKETETISDNSRENCNKENTHSRRNKASLHSHIYGNENKAKKLEVKITYLEDYGEGDRSIVIVFNDVTEREKLIEQRHDSSVCFFAVIFMICMYLFFYRFTTFVPAFALRSTSLTKVAEAMALIMAIVMFNMTSFTFKELGLKTENMNKKILTAIGVSVVACVGLVLLKLWLIGNVPYFMASTKSFFNWHRFTPEGITFAHLAYPLTAILQEFLARTVMQESLLRLFDGKYKNAISILLSSLIFGVLHISYGFTFMIGAALFMAVFGIYYSKSRCLWSVAIIHFILGEVAVSLRLFA